MISPMFCLVSTASREGTMSTWCRLLSSASSRPESQFFYSQNTFSLTARRMNLFSARQSNITQLFLIYFVSSNAFSSTWRLRISASQIFGLAQQAQSSCGPSPTHQSFLSHLSHVALLFDFQVRSHGRCGSSCILVVAVVVGGGDTGGVAWAWNVRFSSERHNLLCGKERQCI
jgi:hypothetical protein